MCKRWGPAWVVFVTPQPCTPWRRPSRPPACLLRPPAVQVLCCVGSPDRAVAEVRRVLRPGGRYLFIEHVAAQPGTRLASVQGWVAPVVRLVADGCNIDRDSLQTIRAAGFSAVQVRTARTCACLSPLTLHSIG